MGRRHDVWYPTGGLRSAAPLLDAAAARLDDTAPELLLRVLCHEFRTPVTVLASLTRALADERQPLSAARRRAISALARDQAGHLQDLLDGAATVTGALTSRAPGLRHHRVPLADLLGAAAALVPRHRRRVRVTRRAAACPVPASSTRRILDNLVGNALRHGPVDGRVGLHATLRRSGLSIAVTDEGDVDPALVEALRRPTPVEGMSGLGLWIVRLLAATDGGRVRLHRLEPRGLAVEVLLPGTSGERLTRSGRCLAPPGH